MDQTLIIVIVVGSILLSFLLPRFLMPLFTGAAKRKKLMATGISARATITSIDQTGTFINEQPKCRIGLRVEPKDGAPFDASATQVVLLTDIPRFQPGQVVTVRYDPANPSSIAIEALGHVRIGETEAKRMIADAEALFEQLNASQSSVAAMAIVTAFRPTGVNVNGDNPLAVLDLKVIPTGETPFDASLVGIFGAQGLQKYQPGKEVHVRFDPADKTRVSFDKQATRVEVSNPG